MSFCGRRKQFSPKDAARSQLLSFQLLDDSDVPCITQSATRVDTGEWCLNSRNTDPPLVTGQTFWKACRTRLPQQSTETSKTHQLEPIWSPVEGILLGLERLAMIICFDDFCDRWSHPAVFCCSRMLKLSCFEYVVTMKVSCFSATQTTLRNDQLFSPLNLMPDLLITVALYNYISWQHIAPFWLIICLDSLLRLCGSFSSLITFQESNSCLSFAMPGLVLSLVVLLVSCLWWQGLLWKGMRLQVGYIQEYVAFWCSKQLVAIFANALHSFAHMYVAGCPSSKDGVAVFFPLFSLPCQWWWQKASSSAASEMELSGIGRSRLLLAVSWQRGYSLIAKL